MAVPEKNQGKELWAGISNGNVSVGDWTDDILSYYSASEDEGARTLELENIVWKMVEHYAVEPGCSKI